MTLSEFKAWFEGFSEGIDKAPTEKQFAKIKAKVADIDGAPITYPIYVGRYVPHPPPYYPWGSYAVGNTGNLAFSLNAVGRNDGVGVSNAATYAYIEPASKGDNQTVTFDSHAAMNALGRAEALN